MKSHNAKHLRALVEADQKLADGERAELLADLRAEEFWSGRAPLLNDELLALRPLEVFVRTIANGGTLSAPQLDELRKALAGLDAARGDGKKRGKAA